MRLLIERPVVLVLVAGAAIISCSDDLVTTSDAGPSVDAVAPIDALANDGQRDGPSPPAIGALIAPIVTPHVDPAAALNDLEKTVGLVVAVVSPRGRGVFGYGLTEVGGSSVPDGDTIFQIGSISKYLTGLALASTLGNELSLGDLVNKYLPALEGANGTKDVTLQHLVTHYSGLESLPSNLADRDGDGQPDPGTDPFSPGAGYTLALLKAYLVGLPTPTQAGKAYSYSNTGSGLLGLALQKHLTVAGYHALLRKSLLDPLKIDDLWGEVKELPAELTLRFAQGYGVKASKRVPGHFGEMGVLAAAGEAVTTGNATLSLLEALTGETPSAIEPAIVESLKPLATTKNGDSIGCAIEIQPAAGDGGPTYKKGGNTVGGFSAFLAFRRDPRVGVMVMANVFKFPAVQQIALSIVESLGK